MKLSVLQKNLAQGLNIVSKAVSPRSNRPILSNILISAEDGRLKLSATDLELGVTTWIGAKIDDPGSTTIPARTLTDLVATFPDDKVLMELTAQTQTLNLSAGSSNAEIKGIDAQEFPPMPEPEADAGVELPVEDLKEMIRQVVFAASNDDARPVLTGVLVSVDGDELIMAAADGFRLSVRKYKLSEALDEPLRAIIPSRALKELARIADDSEKTLRMILPTGRGQVIFSMKNVELRCQLVEGSFPEYQQIIPEGHKTRTIVATDALLKAVRQAEIFARESSLITRLNIELGDGSQPGTVDISAQSEETGSNESKVDATVEGDAVEIAFNVRYLREVLDVINQPNVALETSAAAAPGVIRPMGDEEFLHVIMPMHLGK
jgi:DNA polymerase-3 subunit beta